MEDLYKKEVIDPGDLASQFAKEVCFQGHNNCPAVTIVPHERNNFRGPVGFLWKPWILSKMANYQTGAMGEITYWEMMEEIENDGAGGKPQFFTLVNKEEAWKNLGWEIIAMTADDFARSGRLPCVIDNELQVKRITAANLPLVKALFTGYGEALKQSNLVNITGEVAVMKHSITAFCDLHSDAQLIVTWGASCVGLSSKKLLLNPSNIRPGMLVVGFPEEGYRCNGGTFFTNLLLRKYGPKIEDIINNPEAMAFAEQLTVPSKSYAKLVARLVGWLPDGTPAEPLAEIKGIAHITGGGIWGKFGELLPPGVGAILDGLPAPPAVLLTAQRISQEFPELSLGDHSAYGTFHGGCGMLMIVKTLDDAEIVIDEAAQNNVQANIVGMTTDSGIVRIISKFNNQYGKILTQKNK